MTGSDGSKSSFQSSPLPLTAATTTDSRPDGSNLPNWRPTELTASGLSNQTKSPNIVLQQGSDGNAHWEIGSDQKGPQQSRWTLGQDSNGQCGWVARK